MFQIVHTVLPIYYTYNLNLVPPGYIGMVEKMGTG